MIEAIPVAGKIILAVIFLVVLVCFILNSLKWYCWKHFCYKTLKGFFSTDNTRYCEQCVQDQMNPLLKCSCGWKGRIGDCEEVIQDDTCCDYYCPRCEQKIKV